MALQIGHCKDQHFGNTDQGALQSMPKLLLLPEEGVGFRVRGSACKGSVWKAGPR